MKNLFEDSLSLQTEVKYKAPKIIIPRPTILTMNADSIGDIFKWHYDQMDNFVNRCEFIRIYTLMGSRIDVSCIGTLSIYSEDLLCYLYAFKKSNVNDDMDILLKYYIQLFFCGGIICISSSSSSYVRFHLLDTDITATKGSNHSKC